MEIFKLIEQYYHMKDGEFIENHERYFIMFEDEIEVRLKYKSLKHIVEKILNQKYTDFYIFSIVLCF